MPTTIRQAHCFGVPVDGSNDVTVEKNLDEGLIIRPADAGVVVAPTLAWAVDGVEHLTFYLAHGLVC